MRFPGKWPAKGMTPDDLQRERQLTLDRLRDRGTAKRPLPPRELIAQPAPRGVFLTWSLPERNYQDIVGWRVYKNDENTLYHDLADRGVRKLFVEATAATVSPKFNMFVSSLNGLGKESPKIQIQGAAANESGAPTMPGVPPGYNSGGAGGGDTGTGHGRRTY